MAHFLCDMQRQGIETSIDVVSNSSGTYIQTIKPALKYCDYVIINELEGCQAFA
jgi:sugar/nucleoside kinase (ribokinase family)